LIDKLRGARAGVNIFDGSSERRSDREPPRSANIRQVLKKHVVSS
jgi:hypothetical protein